MCEHQHRAGPELIYVTHSLCTGSYSTSTEIFTLYNGRNTWSPSISTLQIQSFVLKFYGCSTMRPFLCILCVSISMELDLAASGAKDGTCLLHTIRQGNYIHTLRPREGLKCEIHQVAISNTGRLVIYSEDTSHGQRVRETLCL